jgi:hypothetical protein
VNLDLSAATWKKVVRVFVYSFLGVYGAPAIIGALAGSQPVDVNALRSAAVAGLVAVIALFWNAVMDPSPIPSLNPEESK